ncbi:MAG: FtsW/RodA/SpoVE family cell cycle protein [Bacilli bacterium]|nr:FtsW/RodA/SpoVE family cell cycle protein [Bacilli bacterium]
MIRNKNISIYLPIFFLFIISIINLYNAKYLNSFYSNYYIKQIIWYILGIAIIFIIQKLNLKNIFKYSKYIYYANLLLLILVLFIGEEINGTRAWIDFKFFTFQPSEFMKLSLTLYLIEVSSRKENKLNNIFKLTILTLLPSLLVFLEPDTGAIIFFIIVYLFILITKKIKWYFYLIMGILGITSLLLFIYFYLYNQDLLINLIGTSFFYRVDRFINFRTNNYQLELSLISIFGTPFIRNGFNKILLYIPEGATDFIFAFCAGNYGMLMALLIIISYIILLIKISFKIKHSQNKKTNYLVISFILILFFQITINILMNIGLIPIVGITLPFLSYGGSSLMVNFLFLGIILNLTNKDGNRKAHSKNKNNLSKAYKD